MSVCPPVPRHSVRGPRPSSTDEEVSAIDKVHELLLMGLMRFEDKQQERDFVIHLVIVNMVFRWSLWVIDMVGKLRWVGFRSIIECQEISTSPSL